MNLDGGPTLPGLGTVLALTNDFREEVLERKGDKVKLLEKLRANNTEADQLLAEKAEKGMGLLQSQRIPIGHPSSSIIHDAHRTIRALHLKGHGWHMWENATDGPAQIVQGTSMRKYVKSWVTHWDSLRFYPGEECAIEASTWKPSYVEQEDLEKENDQQYYSAADSESAEASPSENKELVAPEISTDPAPSSTSSIM
jgi:hypothetical protein